MDLQLKSKKETDRELAHTDVYYQNSFIGYIIRNFSKYVAINENWNFVSKTRGLKMLEGRTKKELLDKVENELRGI